MIFETDGNGLASEIPSPERICLRPTGNGEWVLGMEDFAYYGDELDAESAIRRQIFDVVQNERADWVRVALKDALAKYPEVDAPEPFSVIPGGVA